MIKYLKKCKNSESNWVSNMDIKKIMNKLDTYIKEYSKLLEENSLLKQELEREKNEKEKVISAIENSKQIVINATEKVIEATNQLEEYEERVDIVFNGLSEILESMIEQENISIKEIEELKEGIKKIKNNLNKPTE